jgi:hypothetical protein
LKALNKWRSAWFDIDVLTGQQIREMAIVAAIVVNVIILVVGRLATGEFPVAKDGEGERTVGFGQVILMTGVSGLIAWGLLAVLERATSRAKTIWTVIAVTAFLLSIVGPLDGGVDTASKIALVLMHVGAAATIIPLMRRTVATRS